MRPKPLVLVMLVALASLRSQAETVTISLSQTNGEFVVSNFSVPSNVTAQVVSCCTRRIGAINTGLRIQIPAVKLLSGIVYDRDTTADGCVTTSFPLVSGPATIGLYASGQTGSSGSAFCTIQLTPSTSFTPSTAVVIPNDGAGPVNIILESSVDLISWNPALPGIYGTSSTNRFFRVRAER
jgi:hypothetical protein